MGYYTFRWNHPASEVYVTGTFDGWSRSTRLEKDGRSFSKRIQLPRERTLYKFIVDGHWTTDSSNPTETEYSGITNNVLDASLIEEPPREPIMSSENLNIQSVSPESTTAALAGAVPKESSRNETANAFFNSAAPDSTTAALAGEVPKSTPTPGADAVPGGFPQTPANEIENQTFSVNPLPASETADNPISLQPGEPVPKGEIGSQSVTSNVKLDQESYERADASNLGVGTTSPMLPEVVTPTEKRAAEGRSILDIPPITASTIPESSLPITGASNATSSGPAVPEVVTESQEKAGVPAEASAVPDSVEKKNEFEEELKSEVPAAPVTADGTTSYTAYAKSAASGVAATIGSVAAAAGLTSAAASTEPTSAVPGVVKDSQAQAGAAPEASAVVEAVEGKKEFESELKAEVPEATPATDGPTAAPIAEENAQKASEQSGPVVTNGVTEQKTVFLSGPKPVTEPIQPVDAVPEPVKESQAEAGASPEASGVPSSVENKAVVETELQQKVNEEEMSPTTTASAFKEESTPVGTPAPSTPPTEQTAPKATETPKNGTKSTSPNGKDKKAKRRSFFGKLKDKLGHKKEGESS